MLCLANLARCSGRCSGRSRESCCSPLTVSLIFTVLLNPSRLMPPSQPGIKCLAEVDAISCTNHGFVVHSVGKTDARGEPLFEGLLRDNPSVARRSPFVPGKGKPAGRLAPPVQGLPPFGSMNERLLYFSLKGEM